ncbi:MAG: hypothetical protein ABIY46_06390 [Gemmatimonadales bacterium]
MTRLMLMAVAAALALGCGSDRSAGRDSGNTAADSTLFGDDRGRQGDTARTVAEVALLERLVDEYEGLDVVMDELAGPSTGSRVQGRAWKGDRHEDATKDRLLALLLTEFGERYHPRTPEGAVATTDSIAALSKEAGTRALEALVLAQHRRVAAAIAAELPTVRNPRVRETLTQLQESLQKEVRKLGGAGDA